MSIAKGKNFWGPAAWRFIHSIAVTYTPDKAEQFKVMMTTFTDLLPCEICQVNLKEKLKKFPIDQYLKSNETLFFWTYVLHDLVNQAINATNPKIKKVSPPYDQVKSFYFNSLNVSCTDCNAAPK